MESQLHKFPCKILNCANQHVTQQDPLIYSTNSQCNPIYGSPPSTHKAEKNWLTIEKFSNQNWNVILSGFLSFSQKSFRTPQIKLKISWKSYKLSKSSRATFSSVVMAMTFWKLRKNLSYTRGTHIWFQSDEANFLNSI